METDQTRRPDTQPQPRRAKRRQRARSWGWRLLSLLILLLGLLVVGMVSLDLHNRGRLRLTCRGDRIALQQGRRIPRPIGFETLGGPFRPVTRLGDDRCVDQYFDDRPQAEAAFLDLLLSQVRETLSRPTTANIPRLRAQLRQGLQITQIDALRLRRREVIEMVADVAYREGRAMLAEVETELRATIARLREAEDLSGDRYGELGEWAQHLESLLRGIAPAPRTTPPPFSGRQVLPPPGSRSSPSAPPPRSAPTAPGNGDRLPGSENSETTRMTRGVPM